MFCSMVDLHCRGRKETILAGSACYMEEDHLNILIGIALVCFNASTSLSNLWKYVFWYKSMQNPSLEDGNIKKVQYNFITPDHSKAKIDLTWGDILFIHFIICVQQSFFLSRFVLQWKNSHRRWIGSWNLKGDFNVIQFWRMLETVWYCYRFKGWYYFVLN